MATVWRSWFSFWHAWGFCYLRLCPISPGCGTIGHYWAAPESWKFPCNGDECTPSRPTLHSCSKSMASDRNSVGRIAASGERYQNSARRLPRGIRIAAAPKRPLRFYPHGNAVPAGTFTLAGDAGSYSVIVTPGGRIRTQRN